MTLPPPAWNRPRVSVEGVLQRKHPCACVWRITEKTPPNPLPRGGLLPPRGYCFSPPYMYFSFSRNQSLSLKGQCSMRFLSSGFFHESIVHRVPRPQINSQKYFWKYFCFCRDIGKFRLTLCVKNTVSKSISLENHKSIQVQRMHVHLILLYCASTGVKLFKIGKFTLFISQFTFRV